MNRRSILFLSFAVAGISTLLIQPHLSQAESTEPRRILIQYKETNTTPNGDVLSTFGVIKLKKGEDLKTRLKEIRKDPLVLRAAPNYPRDLVEAIPNDPKENDQYHIDQDAPGNIDVEKAWSITKGKKSVVIAVIDTGVDLDHPDLASKIWKNTDEVASNGVDDDGNGFVDDVNGWDFYEDNNNPNPKPCSSGENGGVTHGTHVAGIAAASTNNEVGVAGVGWKTKIMALKVANCEGSMLDDDIAPAIEYAVANGAQVINMSLAGIGYSSVLDAVIQEAISKGVTVVAAAGNYSRNLNRIPAYPVCSAGVIGVSASDQNNNIASFSNFGDKCVDVAAPGVDILSTLYINAEAGFNDQYGYLSGTSMASPVVAGLASLIIAQEPDLTSAEVLNVIKTTTEDIGASTSYGTGKVNAVDALLALDSVDPVNIRAYTNSEKEKEHPENTRRKDKTPYFEWAVPELLNSQIAGYYRYFGTNADADAVTKGTFTTKKSFAPSELSNGNEKKYYLKIAAQLTDGTIYTDRGSFTYLHDSVVDGTPSIKSATTSGDDVTFTWKEVQSEHVEKYNIVRRLSTSDDFTKIGSVNASTFTYTDTTGADGTTYVYKIKAVDDLGNKASSAETSVSL